MEFDKLSKQQQDIKIASSTHDTFDHFEAKTQALDKKIEVTKETINQVEQRVTKVDKKLEDTKKDIVVHREIEKKD